METTRRHDYVSQQHAIVSEVQIVPVKPAGGVVGFASLVLNNFLYLGSIAIVSRPTGGFRLLYPTKKLGNTNIDIFHPINRSLANYIEQAVVARYEDVMNKGVSDEKQPLR